MENNPKDYKKDKPDYQGFSNTPGFNNASIYNVSAINDTAGGYDTGGYQYPSKNSIYYGITSNSYMNIEQMGRVLEVSDEGFIYEGAWKTMQAHGYGR